MVGVILTAFHLGQREVVVEAELVVEHEPAQGPTQGPTQELWSFLRWCRQSYQVALVNQMVIFSSYYLLQCSMGWKHPQKLTRELKKGQLHAQFHAKLCDDDEMDMDDLLKHFLQQNHLVLKKLVMERGKIQILELELQQKGELKGELEETQPPEETPQNNPLDEEYQMHWAFEDATFQSYFSLPQV